MRNLTKAVALAVTLGLLSQPMAFAQTDRPVSLAEVQKQARQDASFLRNNYGLLTAGLTTVGAIFSVLYVVKRDNKIIAQQQANTKKLEKELQQSAQENAALKTKNQTLKQGHAVSKQRTDAIRIELKHTKATNAQVEQAYKEEIAALNKKLATMESRFTTSPINIMLRVGNKDLDMQVYRPLLDRDAAPKVREALLKQIKTEPWYTAFSAEQKTVFDKELHYLMEVFRHDGIENEMQQIAKYTVEQALIRDVQPSLRPLFQLLHEVAYKGAKPMAISLLVLGGIVSAQAATISDVKTQQMASRLETNVNLFLELDSEKLAAIEKNDFLYDTCVRIGAMLNQAANSESKDLQEVHTILQNENPLGRPAMQGNKKVAR